MWQALAAIAGQLIDSWSNNRARNKSPALAGKTAYRENYQGLLGRLEAAKIAGIHPALALGGNISGSGAPGMVGSDFRSAFSDAANEISRRREWQAEQDMRKSQEQQQRERNASEQRLNDAQIKHIEKQSQFIDEQIAASQEQRIREAQRQTKSTASGPHDMTSPLPARGAHVDNATGDVIWKPNEVTRSRNGTAVGDNPGYEYIILNGRPTRVPFGTTANHEPSELFQTYRDIDAALDDDGVIGQQIKRFKDWANSADMPGYIKYQTAPRRRYRRKP